jgi:Mg2+/citrate symporter
VTPEPRITPDDIEGKMRELADDVDVITNDVRSVAVTAAAVGIVVVVVVAFWLGRRRGKRGATVLEIRRI